MANRKVTLLWFCKTSKGWRRFSVLMGANGRIKHGYVKAVQISPYATEPFPSSVLKVSEAFGLDAGLYGPPNCYPCTKNYWIG
jgi:hypothetical protein